MHDLRLEQNFYSIGTNFRIKERKREGQQHNNNYTVTPRVSRWLHHIDSMSENRMYKTNRENTLGMYLQWEK